MPPQGKAGLSYTFDDTDLQPLEKATPKQPALDIGEGATGLSAAKPQGLRGRLRNWWEGASTPTYAGVLGRQAESPKQIASDLGRGAAFGSSAMLLTLPPAAIGRTLIGSALGSAGGSFLGREIGSPWGKEELGSQIGGVAGGILGGIAGARGLPARSIPLGRYGLLRTAERVLGGAEIEPSGEALTNVPRVMLPGETTEAAAGRVITPGQRIDPLAIKSAGSAASAKGEDLELLAKHGDMSAREELIRRRSLGRLGTLKRYGGVPLPRP